MAGIIDALVGAFTGPDALIYGAGAAGALIVLLMLPMLLVRRPDPFDRIAATRRDGRGADADASALSKHGHRSARLARFAQLLDPQDAETLSSTRTMLTRAGYPQKDAVRTLMAAQILIGLGLVALGALYAMTLGAEMGLPQKIGYALIPGAVGYYAPRYWVGKRAAKRQEEIQDGFPDALDLLLVCVEAGQSLDQSILRMAHEIEPSYPALASEFLMVSQEMKAGMDRVDVLRGMADRCDIKDITSFVTVLIQSSSFGTSIAEALRVYAAEMRDKRVMRAEEKANVLPTKLTVGTMLFCVPPLLIILIGPSLHGIAQDLSGTSGF